ncbi:hypothetical protein PHIM7_293 [Sinorhizobium phage phiM7]|uniref:Uncharacterized protein n=2 Tax=Emdodecavirus TaxID=1980937 RepID=S5MBN9_9CAUD|nr:hypothetical protein AB690_gp217 [Sinorhizobium phage phiM12]YP_009601418.1 hypothetical protein FDH46_gp185 [Sinorhizobium phage phiM7]AGR48013.1 hypothetical protein SmphiM12_381 [Sinorhizobium phage phiM12]AKF12839.1 hypothetical protein PHIM7_293 [Sinorhizobium phage phiM7]AKF13198.1 hypothetical protein PHIM19_293 [Sinorhizobium phage phiM19]
MNTAAADKKMTVLVYCITGAKNAMYTIRTQRIIPGVMIACNDHYVCNVAATEEKAEEKALAYCARMQERMGDGVVVEYIGFDGGDIIKRRGKLSAYDTQAIEDIEAGEFPFGKHKGEKIVDAPDGYITWLADQMNNPALKPVMAALAAVAYGVAIERGLFAKREARKLELQEMEAKSNFVGTIGERREFEGELISVFGIKNDPSDMGVAYYVNKIKMGDDIIVYAGNKLGERGDTLKIKATIKAHKEYKGAKTTKVNRPKVL